MTNGRENDYLADLVAEPEIPAILGRPGVERRGGCLMTHPPFTLGKPFSENRCNNINILRVFPLLDDCLMASAVAPLVKIRA